MIRLSLFIRLYHPARICTVFRVLLTIFLLIRHCPNWLGVPPLSPERLVQASRKLGIITDSVPQNELADLAEEIFRIFDSSHLSATSMQELAFGVMGALKEYPFKLPQEIIYVMRASSIIEGLGTSYIDNFNGIKDILPILKSSLPRALGEQGTLWGVISHEVQQLPPTMIKFRHLNCT